MEAETAYTLALWHVKEGRVRAGVERPFRLLPQSAQPAGNRTRWFAAWKILLCSTPLAPGGALRISRECAPIRALQR